MRTRADLSWWALLEMVPALPQQTPAWAPESSFVAGQGLAILRSRDQYASLECGRLGGGHGHADRLNLIVHADSEYWLPDLGTGSYVARDLHWYRSTLAHNAPRLDGKSQPRADATSENFDVRGEWAWARGRFGPLTRTLVTGPAYLLDVVEMGGAEDRTLELPWHLSGQVSVEPSGSWEPAELDDNFAANTERLVARPGTSRVLRARGANASMSIHLPDEGDLLRAVAPGAPGTTQAATFYMIRAQARNLRLVSVLESTRGTPHVRTVRQQGSITEIETATGVDRHSPTVEGWEVQTGTETRRLAGSRKDPTPFQPLVGDRPLLPTGSAAHITEPPALDGTLDGFEESEPLQLDHEDQYRRSEEPYAGPEEFSASATLNWSDAAVYLAIDVIKPEVIPRNPNAAPLRLDNEADEIQVDGVQVYFTLADNVTSGFLIVPSTDDGAVIARSIDGYAGSADLVQGSWSLIDGGYRLTLGITPPGWSEVRRGDEIGFDLLVNQMQSDRLRRAGQLVWSGGAGWVWLRGDRQDPSRFGKLELR